MIYKYNIICLIVQYYTEAGSKGGERINTPADTSFSIATILKKICRDPITQMSFGPEHIPERTFGWACRGIDIEHVLTVVHKTVLGEISAPGFYSMTNASSSK